MDITDAQVKAFNEKNIERFLSYYSDNYQAIMLETGQIIADGKRQLSELMTKSFEANPKSRTKILETIKQGNLIINKEKSIDHIQGKTITSVTIYEIQSDKITRMWFGGRVIAK